MDAGIGDETRGAQQHRLQIADAAERIVRVETIFVGKRFGIGGPAFAVAGVPDQLPGEREVRLFGGQRAFEMMAGYRLVIDQRRQAEVRPVGEAQQVDLEPRRIAPVRGAGRVGRRRGGGRERQRHHADRDGAVRHRANLRFHDSSCPRGQLRQAFDKGGAAKV